MEFNYRIWRKPESVINKVCALAQDKIVVSGTNQSGRFTGLFEGRYSVTDDNASITITRKPLFVSWSTVEKGLKYLVA